MIIGVTERPTYQDCRRKWDLTSSNRQNLEKIIPHSPALPLGTVIHAALKGWLEHPNQEPNVLFHIAAIEANNQIIKAYTQATGSKPTAGQLEKLHEALVIGESMMTNYKRYWGKPLPTGFELVSPEQEVTIPIPGTEHSLRGRFDGIVVDTKTQLLYVLEHKSYGQRPKMEVLATNDQFIAYHWMLIKLDIGPVGGIAYDGMWKRAAPPKGLELKDLFTRIRITHTPAELVEFEDMLKLEANEMASNPPITKHRTWNGSCFWGCGVSELCMAMSRGEDVDYVRRSMYKQREDHDRKNHDID